MDKDYMHVKTITLGLKLIKTTDLLGYSDYSITYNDTPIKPFIKPSTNTFTYTTTDEQEAINAFNKMKDNLINGTTKREIIMSA